MVNTGARIRSHLGLMPKSILLIACRAARWEWPPGYYLLGVDSGLRLPQLHLTVVLPLEANLSQHSS